MINICNFERILINKLQTNNPSKMEDVKYLETLDWTLEYISSRFASYTHSRYTLFSTEMWENVLSITCLSVSGSIWYIHPGNFVMYFRSRQLCLIVFLSFHQASVVVIFDVYRISWTITEIY